MFKKISSLIQFPDWMSEGSRWRKLDLYDRLLDGTFYDHLPFCFYDETTTDGRYIPLSQRRPSCQYRLPRYVARWAARKLFAGRHVPKVKSEDKEVEAKVNAALTGTRIWPTMFEAAYRGTVGSVAITFRVDGDRIGLKVWRAVWCSPVFDDFGELLNLRVHYRTSGADLAMSGIQVERPGDTYWFIRDYGTNQETTYRPVLVQDWNPVQGFTKPDMRLEEESVVEHGLGFVPGVWIANPGGVGLPDGAALWEDAVPDTIEVDYLLSQAARGSRYNCAPQLVTKGQFAGGNADGINPATTLHFEADHKDAEGNVLGGGDAKLLEMSGAGTEAALKIVDALKKMAHEQIGVVQKDPSEMPGPLSGRAMEYLDEDAHDTAMQWRTTYGEGGALPLICKILRVKEPDLDTSNLWLQWPRIYQPTPADLQSIVEALIMASRPIAVEGAQPGEDGSVPTLAPLLDRETASAFLVANMDLGILDDTNGGPLPGKSGGVPNPQVSGEEGTVGDAGPFWRILPPIKVS